MPKRWSILFLLSLGFIINTQAQDEKVVFSAPGGFYDSCFHVTLECYYANHHVRYTTNGNVPTASSPRFEEPLRLDENLFSKSEIYTVQVTPDGKMFYPDQVQRCIVIRAAVFDQNDNRISQAVANTYFIKELGNDSHDLPLVSLCADSLDLFDYERGIFVPGIHFNPSNPDWSGNYYQQGREWEREINLEFYEPDNTGINQRAGLRTHGGNGRRYQQKNLSVYAREDYGKKRFKHQFFESLPINSFKHLQLKPFSSAWTPSGLHDPVSQDIASLDLEVESLATRPAVLYLNGEYWGIYYLHEKPDERYLEDHFGTNIDNCDIMGNWKSLCEYGDCNDFIETMDWLSQADLSNPIDYSRVENYFDLESFIDYQILELFLANKDWPANNMRCWREGNGKWRWIFYDGDGCLIAQDFDVFANATYFGNSTWPASSSSTLLFRRLLANEGFREQFSNRFQELVDSHFQYAETHNLFSNAQNAIWDEIPSQAERFGTPKDMNTWTAKCDQLDDFLKKRPSTLLQQFNSFFQSKPWNYSEWQCFPIPSAETLYVSFHADHAGEEPIGIYDITGRCVYSASQEIHAGHNLISLDPELSAGVYVLTFGEKRQIFVRF